MVCYVSRIGGQFPFYIHSPKKPGSPYLACGSFKLLVINTKHMHNILIDTHSLQADMLQQRPLVELCMKGVVTQKNTSYGNLSLSIHCND